MRSERKILCDSSAARYVCVIDRRDETVDDWREVTLSLDAPVVLVVSCAFFLRRESLRLEPANATHLSVARRVVVYYSSRATKMFR